jgi:hypothetical protein
MSTPKITMAHLSDSRLREARLGVVNHIPADPYFAERFPLAGDSDRIGVARASPE